MSEKFFLEIEWDVPDMPRYIGPFESRDEAVDFGSLNVPNGTWFVAPLSYPYRKEARDDNVE